MEVVWIFHGEQAQFCSAVFKELDEAEAWVRSNQFTGILTKYPVGLSVYDWAVENQHFKPNRDNPKTGSFIQNFTTASLDHRHYQDGVRE